MKISASHFHADWGVVRKKRDQLLAFTDRYVLPDFPISPEQLELIKAYRAELRSITSRYAHPDDVVLPTFPIDKA